MNNEPVLRAVTDSGLVIDKYFIENLRQVGLESLASYYEGVYNLFAE